MWYYVRNLDSRYFIRLVVLNEYKEVYFQLVYIDKLELLVFLCQAADISKLLMLI
jgi:hypothetical protein